MVNRDDEEPSETGSALEKVIENIFRTAGFTTKRNVNVAGYEIDVLAQLNDVFRVAIECKNYQRSNLTVRNLIHQWNSKNLILQNQKVIIAIAGKRIKNSDKKLANKFNLEVWDEDDINKYQKLMMTPSKLRKELLSNISISIPTISEYSQDVIRSQVVENVLNGNYYSDYNPWNEEAYEIFGELLRTYVLVNLWFNEPSKEERKELIDIFEGAKYKTKRFLFFFKRTVKMDYEERWEKLKEIFQEEKRISEKTQKDYLKNMKEIESVFKNKSQKYLNKKLNKSLIKDLVRERIEDALLKREGNLLNNEKIVRLYGRFKKEGMVENTRTISIKVSEGNLKVLIENINSTTAREVDWIFCKPHEKYVLSNNVEDVNIEYLWNVETIEDCVDKIYRYLEEYEGTNDSLKLYDRNLQEE